ncbi:MAG: hypothetical protein A3F18_00700 [Legionellales bacterium RIFCSPHIGHO2_12_FULL_37_14]|nr:MAG: hypothetical protein A3F18_00700 [Legionellales bacterium RIFCSPHIGHO2_12_FULL_37_14]
MTDKNYIGLAVTPHDPAICILNTEGEIVFAQAAERYLQNKRAWHSPADDVLFVKKLIKEYCDPTKQLVLSLSWDKKYLKNRHFTNLLNRWVIEKLLGSGWLGGKKSTFAASYHEARSVYAGFNELAGFNTEYQYYNLTTKPVIYQYNEHHLTHAAAACYSSKFKEAACAVVDGNGQGTSVNFYNFKDGKIKLIPSNSSRLGSLGIFYWFICKGCGFEPLEGEEWKVMGLASYGKLNEEYYAMMKDSLTIDGINVKVSFKTLASIKKCLKMARKKDTPALEYADFAYTGQYVFAEYFNKLLDGLYKACPGENLVLAGGCALNSSYVGTIHKNTPFKNVYVFSAPADDGNAVGAALLAYYKNNEPKVRSDIQLPYLGSTLTKNALDRLKTYSKLNIKTDYSMQEVTQITAKLLSEGKMVGWVQGRAEFGPRALGNRSILADPRSASVKERLNAEVKFREEFRPFAPSILHEFGDEYFEHYRETPYMERALVFKQEVRDKVPGVVHIDGTGRLQTVKAEWNKPYYDLIKAFYAITKIPILLNTSFNVMGKPIIHSVEDALAVFFMSGLDVLVLENNIIFK